MSLTENVDASLAVELERVDYSDLYRAAVPGLATVDGATLAAAFLTVGSERVGRLIAAGGRLPIGERRRLSASRAAAAPGVGDQLGPFRVLALAPGRAVLGSDAWHLSFRAVLEHSAAEGEVAVSTVVQWHNPAGRAYFAGIRPAHVRLATWATRSMARSLAKAT